MTSSKVPEPCVCHCDSLDEAADDPNCAIIFDETMNEYHLESRDGRGHSIVRHCPFCGGRTPASRRERLFAKPPREEFQRLKELTKDIHTIDDALRILGTPGWDNPHGATSTKPGADGNPPITTVHRMLWYYDLSGTTNVCVTESNSGGAQVSFQHKELKPGELPPAGPPMRARDLRSKQSEAKETLFCAMCGKTNHEATRMIAVKSVCICDACVKLCMEILES